MAPILHVMRLGWSENEVRCSVKEGRRDAEFKWQHLVEEPKRYDTEWIRSTISLNKTREFGYVAPLGQREKNRNLNHPGGKNAWAA